MKWIVTLLALLVAHTGGAATLPALVEKALLNLEKNNLEEWTYTRITISNGSKTVEKFDPRKEGLKKWALLEKEGKKPTDEELATYLKTQKENEDKAAAAAAEAKKKGETKEGDDSMNLRKMIDPTSVKLLEEDSKTALYQFGVIMDQLGAETSKKLFGKLKIIKGVPYVETMEFAASEPFSPMTSVKVSELLTIMKFSPLQPGGPVLPSSMRMRFKGTILFVKEMDQNSMTVYKDFEFIGKKVEKK